MRCFRPLLLTVLCVTSGCASTMSISSQSSDWIIQEKDPSCSPENIAKLQPGSEVSIVETQPSGRKMLTRGVVLKSGPEGIALMNSVRMAASTSDPLPSFLPMSRLFKTTGIGAIHVPVYWVPANQLASLTVDNPPPADFVVPNVAIEMNNSQFYERIGIDFNFDVKDGSGPVFRSEKETVIPWQAHQSSSKSE